MAAIYERYAYFCRAGINSFLKSNNISDALQLTDASQLPVYVINNRYKHSHTHTFSYVCRNVELSCNIIRSPGENMICACVKIYIIMWMLANILAPFCRKSPVNQLKAFSPTPTVAI